MERKIKPFNGVSYVYPFRHIPMFRSKGWDGADQPAKELVEFVGGDCWGIYIKRGQQILPITNTYALYEKFGEGYLTTRQGMLENKVRDNILESPKDLLLWMEPKDELCVMLGDNVIRYAIFCRTQNGKSWTMADFFELTKTEFGAKL